MFNVKVTVDRLLQLQFGAIYIYIFFNNNLFFFKTKKLLEFQAGRGAPLAGRSAPPRQW